MVARTHSSSRWRASGLCGRKWSAHSWERSATISGFSLGRTIFFAVMPCLNELRLAIDLPASVVGPFDRAPLARLVAARCSGVCAMAVDSIDEMRPVLLKYGD